MDSFKTADEVYDWLVAEAGEVDPLFFASHVIMKLASDVSYGYIRAVPYDEVRPPPPPPPTPLGGEYDKVVGEGDVQDDPDA